MTRLRHTGFWLVACCFVLVATARASVPSGQPFTDPQLQVEELIGGLQRPTAMAFLGPGDLLVLQKNDGRVLRVLDGVLQPGEALDLAVNYISDRGLLGIAVHPQFPLAPYVYLYYTASQTDADSSSTAATENRLVRYTWDGAALSDPAVLLILPSTVVSHQGGVLAFGLDGTLFLVIGDLNRNGLLQNFPDGPAPDDSSVIIRLNDDGTIPADNPFVSQGEPVAKYYAYGIRNSFGLAVDPLTGVLWDTENGASVYDEVNRVAPGFNSGWETIMGPDARDPDDESALVQLPGAHYSDPEFSWLEQIAPTALAFVTTTALGQEYEYDLLVADFIHGAVYRFELNALRDGLLMPHPDVEDLVADNEAERQHLVFGEGLGDLTDMKIGPDGRLYLVSHFDGRIVVVSRLAQGGPTADVAVTASDSPDPVLLNGTLTYTATMTNGGPEQATDVVLTATPPSSAAFISASSTQGACSGTGPVVCTIGTVPMDASAVATIRVRADTLGVLSTLVGVAAGETDLDGTNNEVVVSTSVTQTQFQLKVSKNGNAGGTVASQPAGITCGSDCSQSYPGGTVVDLTATPNAGAVFGGWGGPIDCVDGNVTVSAAMTCTAAFNGPDLKISSLSAPNKAAAGQAITITDTTNNDAPVPASASTTTLFFSSNSSLDTGDAPLGSRAVPPLAAGTTHAQGTLVTMPANAPIGTSYIIAKADGLGDVLEAKETNNTKSSSILVGPDLVISSLSAPASAAAGASITITVKTKNEGSEPAAASTTRVFFSSDNSLDGGDVALADLALPALNAGQSATRTVAVVIPSDAISGTRYLIAAADATGAVPEAKETNNRKSKSLVIP